MLINFLVGGGSGGSGDLESIYTWRFDIGKVSLTCACHVLFFNATTCACCTNITCRPSSPRACPKAAGGIMRWQCLQVRSRVLSLRHEEQLLDGNPKAYAGLGPPFIFADVLCNILDLHCRCVMKPPQLEIIEAKNVIGDTVLSKAVECGDADLFELVRKCVWDVLRLDQVWA